MLLPADKAQKDAMLSARVPSVLKRVLSWYGSRHSGLQGKSEAIVAVELLHGLLSAFARREGLVFVEWHYKRADERDYQVGFCVFNALRREGSEPSKSVSEIPIDLFHHFRRFGVMPFFLEPGLYVFYTDDYDTAVVTNREEIEQGINEELIIRGLESEVKLSAPIADLEAMGVTLRSV